MPRRGYFSLNGKPYLMAPSSVTRGRPAIQLLSAKKDMMPDPSRRDIIPVQGGLPGEFWLWYDRFDGGVASLRYRRRYTHRVDSNTPMFCDSRFGWLHLDVAPLTEPTWTAQNDDATAVFEENSELLVLNGQIVELMAASPSQDVDLSSTDADADPANAVNWEVSGADVVLIGTGSHIFKRVGGVWSSAAIATEHLAVGPGSLWKSYLSGGVYFISTCNPGSDPLTAASWSSGVQVGHSGVVVTGLAVSGDELAIGTTVGLFGLTPEGDAFNRLTGIAANVNNGRGMIEAFGYDWYPTRDNGLYAYRNGTIYPGQDPGHQSDDQRVTGYVQTLYQQGEWLIAVTVGSNAGLKHFWRGRLRHSTDESGPLLKWFFWSYSEISDTERISMLQTDIDIGAVTDKMLWIAQDGQGHGYWRPDFKDAENTEFTPTPSAAALQDSGTFYFPDDDLGFPFAQKRLRSAVVDGRQIDSDALVRLRGRFDGQSAWGPIDMTATATLVSITDATESKLSGYLLRDFYLELFDDSAGTSSPIVKRFGMRYFVRGDGARHYRLLLHLGGPLDVADGIVIEESPENQIVNLMALAENQAELAFGGIDADYTVLIGPDISFTLLENTEDGDQWLVELECLVW